MENLDNKDTRKFYSLASECNKKNYSVYDEAFDYALNDENIHNIAVTGEYGSGKSSIWKTYEKSKNMIRNAHICVGNYNSNLKNESFETKIVHQLLLIGNRKKLNNCNYQIKQNKSKFKFILGMLAVIFLIITILEFNKIGKSFKLLFLILDIVIILGISWYLNMNIRFIKKIKVDRVEIEKDIYENLEINDIFMELTYILYTLKIENIVFEDLDRIENCTDILVKLKELNFYINSYIDSKNKKFNVLQKIQGKANNKKLQLILSWLLELFGYRKTINFIYMVKDDIFFKNKDSNDQIDYKFKFFDFIIPVIPIITKHNSESQISDMLKDDDNLSKRYLASVSVYISDMRMLKSIVNEYNIYKDIVPIDILKLNYEKLFSLIVVKTLYCDEYHKLISNEGDIYNILRYKNELLEKYDCNISWLFEKDNIDNIHDDNYYSDIDRYDEVKKSLENISKNPLIRFLLSEEYIDNTYQHYINYFHNGGLGVNDNIYLKDLVEYRKSDMYIRLENPELILDKIREFNNYSNINVSLVQYCISEIILGPSDDLVRFFQASTADELVLLFNEIFKDGSNHIFSIDDYFEIDRIVEIYLSTTKKVNHIGVIISAYCKDENEDSCVYKIEGIINRLCRDDVLIFNTSNVESVFEFFDQIKKDYCSEEFILYLNDNDQKKDKIGIDNFYNLMLEENTINDNWFKFAIDKYEGSQLRLNFDDKLNSSRLNELFSKGLKLNITEEKLKSIIDNNIKLLLVLIKNIDNIGNGFLDYFNNEIITIIGDEKLSCDEKINLFGFYMNYENMESLDLDKVEFVFNIVRNIDEKFIYLLKGTGKNSWVDIENEEEDKLAKILVDNNYAIFHKQMHDKIIPSEQLKKIKKYSNLK